MLVRSRFTPSVDRTYITLPFNQIFFGHSAIKWTQTELFFFQIKKIAVISGSSRLTKAVEGAQRKLVINFRAQCIFQLLFS